MSTVRSSEASGSSPPERSLGDLVLLRRGHDLTWKNRRAGSVPVMGSAGVNGFHDVAIAPGPGVVLGRSGASFGRAHYIDRPFWPHNTALYVTDFRGNDPRYVYYLLSSIDFSSYNSGGAQQSLNRNFIAPIMVRVPRHGAQVAIARVLDDAVAEISGIERMISKKQSIKQGMMQQLLTGKSRLPGFAARWTDGSFDQLAVPSRERAMPRDVAATTPLVELEQIEGASGRVVARSQASEAVSLKAVFRPGDVLFGKLRAYLRKFWYADVAGLCTTEMWVLRARPGVDSRFVRYVVETDRFIEVASGAYGTHMPRSDWGIVRNLKVRIPPLDEQVAIASALADLDEEVALLLGRLRKAESIKQGLMQELLSGRTPPPVEEPAA